MFFLARLRAIPAYCLLFLSLVHAREDSLFTSSVTYCEPPETLLIQQFDVAYFSANQSVVFNISAASVEANVYVNANLLLNVYGMNPVNVTLDLCEILGGALCPLPKYNFVGSDSISLPESLGVLDKIPKIAFHIPDLEGFAQLVLTEVGTGDVKACVQATLSNGWSTHQPAVEWATGGLALAALISAAWQSVSPEAIAPSRLLDLLYLYQTIASTSFLSLNYPSTYRAFTLNFAWAMGLFSTSSPSSLQTSINHMRHLTGGRLADATSSSAVSLVNRKLSPYNAPNSQFIATPPIIPRALEFDLSSFANFSTTSHQSSSQVFKALAVDSGAQGEVQTVTSSSSNVLQAGIPIYVNSIHIATANAFMTVLLCTLILFGIALGMFVLGYAVLMCQRVIRSDLHLPLRTYRFWICSWIFRLGIVVFPPITTFAFYQWTLKDSWLSILLSIIAFLITVSLVTYPTFVTCRLARSDSSQALYSKSEHLTLFGPFYVQYRTPRFYFFIIILVASFLKSFFTAFAKASGEVQIIAMVIIEGVVVTLHCLLRPHNTRGGDIFSTFLAIIRLVCTGLMIAFVERLNVAPIPRVAIGLVAAVIFSVAVIVTAINLAFHSGIGRIWSFRGYNTSNTSGSASESMLEKGKISNSNSSEHIGRPVNPTPEQSLPLNSHFLQPYPVSPTETVEQPSVYTRDSGTITVGSLMPRRWSFSPLNSPTNSSQAHEPSSYSSHSTNMISGSSSVPLPPPTHLP
ncbi:hypothetical protein BDZ94DRAFT_1221694 [Collybia nuda]|uniref:ML-like domain-containing protein n=1 Tax=Collybia nuda TaxID=64659 RepID=A0A9P5Y4U1_9AGAR|nr:hypothetical protein BDZ94DRAFT_1221694 [Collybia nuda]